MGAAGVSAHLPIFPQSLNKQGTTMKTYKLISTLIVVLSTYTINAHAHDPKEHAKENEKQAPNCAAMQDMEKDKMDKNDPVMMAMMKKCHKMADEHKSDNKMEHMKDMKDMKDMKHVEDSEDQGDDQNHH